MNQRVEHPPQALASPAHRHDRKRWMVWGKRALTAFFFVLVPVLLYLLVQNLDWQEVSKALQATGIPATSIRLVKPADTTGTGDTNAESRRVDVTVTE